MPPTDKVCAISNLYPFMIAASYKSSDLFMIYNLVRQFSSFANCISQVSHTSSDSTIRTGKKTKAIQKIVLFIIAESNLFLCLQCSCFARIYFVQKYKNNHFALMPFRMD